MFGAPKQRLLTHTKSALAVLAVCALWLIACSGDPAASTDADAGAEVGSEAGSACVPKTCARLRRNCGRVDNGCGDQISCGACAWPETCGGGGVPNVCGGVDGGTCTPTTCAARGKNCGSIDNGCGESLDCGHCPSGSTCGATIANVCSTPCVPNCNGRTCGPDLVCGTSCGTCSAPQTCGGGGVSGKCGPVGSNLFKNGSRIGWQTLATSDGARSYYMLYDRQLHASCWPLNASDGQLRCLPRATASASSYFSDATCTTKVAYDYANCGQTPAYAAQSNGSGFTTFPVTGTFTGAVYIGGPGNCRAYTRAPPDSFYTIGSAIPPTSLVAMTKLGPGQTPTPSATDIYQDGTRLRLQVLSTADGATSPWPEFLDQQLATECSFSVAGDGQQRCMPADTTIASDRYADTACTQPVLDIPASSIAPHYANKRDARGCATSSYYRVSSAHSGTTYQNTTSTCVAAPVDPTHVYYTLAPVAASAFESATVGTPPASMAGFQSGSRLTFTVTTGTDGSRTFGNWHDTQLGVDCAFVSAADGVLRCVPVWAMAYVQPYFADSACTIQLAASSPCTIPSFAQTTGTCNANYYSIGARHTGPVYFSNGATCSTIATSEATAFYRLGAATPSSAFAAATITLP
jgi:hypothetical protein